MIKYNLSQCAPPIWDAVFVFCIPPRFRLLANDASARVSSENAKFVTDSGVGWRIRFMGKAQGQRILKILTEKVLAETPGRRVVI